MRIIRQLQDGFKAVNDHLIKLIDVSTAKPAKKVKKFNHVYLFDICASVKGEEPVSVGVIGVFDQETKEQIGAMYTDKHGNSISPDLVKPLDDCDCKSEEC